VTGADDSVFGVGGYRLAVTHQSCEPAAAAAPPADPVPLTFRGTTPDPAGGYRAGFGPALPAAETFAAGTLTGGRVERAVTVGQNRLYQLALTATGAGVRTEVVDAGGRVVASLRAAAGMPAATAHAYLPAGTYRVVTSAPGGWLTPTTFALTGRVASDPVGPGYTDEPTDPPAGGPPSPPGGPTVKVQRKSWDRPYYF
jgi:hypothetical protein